MSVTFPLGFRARGIRAGLRNAPVPDLALIINDGPRDCVAGVFTTNRVCAAPVRWSREVVADHKARAVIVNSAVANACTGNDGLADSKREAEYVAALVGCEPHEVVVASTGVIGVRLDMPSILKGAAIAHSSLGKGDVVDESAARAIMTTDTVPKTATVENNGARFGGIAKGAGMLAPQLATMLVFVTTDAVVDAEEFQDALAQACEVTFSRVDSDACMSTNDTVVAMASGASGVTMSKEDLVCALTQLCANLARQLVADAEGSHHDVKVTVRGATTTKAAVAVAREVTRSNLVKTAIAGNDPNWGRILAAVGCVPESVAPFDPDAVDVSVNGIQVCRSGGIGDDRDLVDMSSREVHIDIELHAGEAEAAVWTNDLTHEYVEENSAYTS
ncbi:bifunctional glutamate N-acetyltransferase/amino-acid acetyltransferase ArgJ [Cutibacterium sp.]|uniref:bifunctional glutamate N-acetyltransferase/amino-acid acetyltransferase ArgJ n=1 Tax=Cutibacterium sp. TaxID=1912221 RepID=UPI0026DC4DB7|nr:bifunctional glutamate N-acetyltransferase/amino-acid acetyltransferase ArgJ [Cutibacterium sp.]MDO4412110.1 bifunctional glutamate N-acetyltransferase/amino-acid acetyltransferase ArgJ [Cutibacterium sp.]